MPEVAEGDYLLFHDAGAYTFSMWSRYNSRQAPKIIGYSDGGAEFEVLKQRERIDAVLDFWEK